MRYIEAVHFLSRFERFGIKLGLKRIKELLAFLDNPQDKVKIIHVTGTNGKGSVSSMIAYILRASGFRVGLFTSPHLVDWRERFMVFDGTGVSFISKKEFSEGLERLKPVLIRLKKERKNPTLFELLTALAFDYFARQKLDFAVMEVGLGGRLDATNVGTPLVSIITNISLEHQQYLGNNLKAIAGEKAAIIKKQGVVVTGETKPVPLKVIKAKCRDKSARLIQVGKDVKITSYRFKSFRGKFNVYLDIMGLNNFYRNLELSLIGKHQAFNAATAVSAVESLIFYGIKISPRAIRTGLKTVNWPARFELIAKKPLVFLDGAHNPGAASAVVKTIKEVDSFRELFLVFGCLKDKDYKGMLESFLPLASEVIITRSRNNRSLEPSIISRQVKEYGVPFVIQRNPVEALKLAFKKAKTGDFIFITGSLYLAGEIKRYLLRFKGKEKI